MIMKKFLLSLLLLSLPTLTFAGSACTGTELEVINNTGLTLTVDSVLPEKGNLDLAAGTLIKTGQALSGKMTKTVDGTSRGYISLRFPDHTVYNVRYDYHIQKSGFWTCIKEIKSTAEGTATTKYEHALQGEERKGNSRSVVIYKKIER